MINPIYKKGAKDKAENYGAITLMDTGSNMYISSKIYTEILRNRLDKFLEEKRAYGKNQLGFRKEKESIEAMYTLKSVEEERKQEK